MVARQSYPLVLESAQAPEFRKAVREYNASSKRFITDAFARYADSHLPKNLRGRGWFRANMSRYPFGAEVDASIVHLLGQGQARTETGSNESLLRFISYNPRTQREDRVFSPGYFTDPVVFNGKGRQVWNAVMYAAFAEDEPVGLVAERAVMDAIDRPLDPLQFDRTRLHAVESRLVSLFGFEQLPVEMNDSDE